MAESNADIADGEIVLVQGSAKVPYELKNVGGVYSCSCPAWRNAGGPIDRRTCKHLKAHRGADVELARIGSDGTGASPALKKTSSSSSTTTSSSSSSASVGESKAPPVLLAHSWQNEMDLAGWWMSEKLDGVRAWWDGERFVSRLGNTFLAPAWFRAVLPAVALDGELWVGRQCFQETVSIVRRQDAGDQWHKVRFLVFDAPHLSTSPFEARVSWIKDFVDGVVATGASHVQAVDHQRCKSTDHLRTELARVEGLGGEGLMLRRPASLYESGRSTSLLKVKTFHDAEARVVSHEAGKGKHTGKVGALVVEMATANGPATRFKVGTGLSDAERANPPVVGSLITYRYQELTKDGVPRFPSYVGLAIDKAGPTVASSTPLPALPTSTAAPTPMASASATGVPVSVSSSPIAGGETKGPSLSVPKRLVFEGEASAKFWEVVVDGASHTVTFGKVGTAGQTRTKTFATAAAARVDARRLVAEKTAKGYVVVG